MKKINAIILIVTIVFLLAIAFDLSPFLRGPAPYSPDWRWPYQIPHLSIKLLLPILVGGGIIALYKKYSTRQNLNSRNFFLILIPSVFLFQVSLLLASNQGIFVLVHRMINPDLSGYFTVATRITTVSDFIKHFNSNLNDFPMLARFHPPLDILFYYFLNKLALIITPFTLFVSSIQPTHADVLTTWNGLLEYQKVGAILGAVITPLLGLAGSIPLFCAIKNLYNETAAIRVSFLYMLTPALLLFAPLPDVIYPFFVTLSFFFLSKAIQSRKTVWFLLAGVTLSVASLFTLTCLPILLLYALYYLFYKKAFSKISKFMVKDGLMVAVGFLLPLAIFQFVFDLNIITMLKLVLEYHNQTQSGRNYLVWLPYNLYDFFIFLGVPTTILFLNHIKQSLNGVKNRESIKQNAMLISFLFLILLLDLLGSVKGENGRVWLPYMVFPAIAVGSIAPNKGNAITSMLIALLVLQIIIFQLFLVPLW